MRNPLNGIKCFGELLIHQYASTLDIDGSNVPEIMEKLDNIEHQTIQIESDDLINEYVKPTIDINYLATHCLTLFR